MSPAQPAARKPRADVARNRARILDTALRHFTEHGVGTSLEALAKDAGVGPATLYRHFPTREALLAAALDVRGEALLARLEPLQALARSDADEGLRQWLLALEGYLNTFSGLPEPVLAALAAHSSPSPPTARDSSNSPTTSSARRSGTAPHAPPSAPGTSSSPPCSWPGPTGPRSARTPCPPCGNCSKPGTAPADRADRGMRPRPRAGPLKAFSAPGTRAMERRHRPPLHVTFMTSSCPSISVSACQFGADALTRSHGRLYGCRAPQL